MANFVIGCDSGVTALVSASSLEQAQADWDSEVAKGNAEPGIARRPRPGEVREISSARTHDYRRR
jgi:hypothetical protein